jgi:hypothetical protein
MVPNPTAFLVHSPSRGLSDNAVVVEIIDKDTKCWNDPLIKEVFVENGVAEICQILISSFNGRDQQIWRCTGNEDFIVNSTYHLDRNLAANNIGECSYVQHQCSIWKMTVPNVVKVFRRRACKNALPTKANLLKRKVVDDLICPICGVIVETMGYI